MIINIDNLTFQYIGKGFPLPAGMDWHGEVEILGRLLSTKCKGKDWKVSDDLKPFLSASPYQPFLHLKGDAYVYTTNKEKEKEYIYNDKTIIVSRKKRYWGRDFLLKIFFKDEVKDLSYRKERKEFFDYFENKTVFEIEQGNLSISRIEEDFSRSFLLNFPFISETHFMSFFNHEIHGGKCLILCAGYDFKRFIFVSGTLEDAVIVSPDHLEKTILLGKGAYLLEHPKPSKGEID